MAEPETRPQRRFIWPADYYSGPAPVAVLPRGVAYGCGGAATFLLILVMVGGALLSRGGLAEMMDLTVGMTVGEMKGMYGADVTAVQKQELEGEIERMRKSYREGRLPLPALQPFLQQLQQASSDKRITAPEAVALRDVVRKVNAKSSRRG